MSLYFKIFLASFWIIFLSYEIAVSISRHIPFLLSRIMMSSLLFGAVLSFVFVDTIVWLLPS